MSTGMRFFLILLAFLIACCVVEWRRNRRRHGCGRWTRPGRRGTLPAPSREATRYATPGSVSQAR